VTDLSFREGTIIDELSLPTDNESVYKVKVPLMGDKIACPVYEKKEVHFFFITLGNLDKHLIEHHISTAIQWICVECEKSFPELHGARCHIPKCRGLTLISEGRFRCGTCPMSFGSQRGLSTYERHAHLIVRKAKGRGTHPPNLDHSKRLWSEEEVALLKELDSKFKDHKYPNIEISKILTSETVKQIKYKREMIKTNIEPAFRRQTKGQRARVSSPIHSGRQRIAQ
jgi:hypothetical protein